MPIISATETGVHGIAFPNGLPSSVNYLILIYMESLFVTLGTASRCRNTEINIFTDYTPKHYSPPRLDDKILHLGFDVYFRFLILEIEILSSIP